MSGSFIRFHCLKCRKRLKAHTDDAGKKAHCSCGQKFEVPGVPAEPDYIDVEYTKVAPKPKTTEMVVFNPIQNAAAEEQPFDFDNPFQSEDQPIALRSNESQGANDPGGTSAFSQIDNSAKDYTRVKPPSRGITVGEAVACCFLIPLIGVFVWFVASTVSAKPDLIYIMLILCGVIGAYAILSWLIGMIIGKPALHVMGSILIGFFGVMAFAGIVLALIAGSKGGKMINFCSNCGHTWYPRGSFYSARCPSCGRVRV